MDVTELAHWRYRVKAIPADIQACLNRSSSLSRYTGCEDPEAQRVRMEKYRGYYERQREELEFHRYLLEEAKFMCELGELTLT